MFYLFLEAAHAWNSNHHRRRCRCRCRCRHPHPRSFAADPDAGGWSGFLRNERVAGACPAPHSRLQAGKAPSAPDVGSDGFPLHSFSRNLSLNLVLVQSNCQKFNPRFTNLDFLFIKRKKTALFVAQQFSPNSNKKQQAWSF